jgi:hypothetical protein
VPKVVDQGPPPGRIDVVFAENQFFGRMHSDDLRFYRHRSNHTFILAADFEEVAHDGLKLDWAFTNSRHLDFLRFQCRKASRRELVWFIAEFLGRSR